MLVAIAGAGAVGRTGREGHAMRVERGGIAAVTVAALAIVVGAASAWACTDVTSLSVNPGEAPAGSRVMLSGTRFGGGPVDVRWDSTTGALLTTAEGPDFTVAVNIPTTANLDTHLIYARGSDGDKSVVIKVVAGSADQGTGTAPRATSQGTNSGTSATGLAGPPRAEEAGPANPTPSPAPSGSSGAAFPTPASSTASGQPPVPAPANSPSASSDLATAPLGPDAGVQASLAMSSRPGRAGSRSPTGASSGNLPLAQAMADDDDDDASPSVASVKGDLWSGFQPGLPSERGTSLTEPTPSSKGWSPQTTGALLLVGGLVALFAGFAAAELRRPRVRAR